MKDAYKKRRKLEKRFKECKRLFDERDNIPYWADGRRKGAKGLIYAIEHETGIDNYSVYWDEDALKDREVQEEIHSGNFEIEMLIKSLEILVKPSRLSKKSKKWSDGGMPPLMPVYKDNILRSSE